MYDINGDSLFLQIDNYCYRMINEFDEALCSKIIVDGSILPQVQKLLLVDFYVQIIQLADTIERVLLEE